MPNLLLLLMCFGLGVFLRRTGRFPEQTPAVLNAFILHVSLPALILLHVHQLTLDWSLLYPPLMPWCLFGIGLVFFRTSGRLMHWAPSTTGGLIFASSLANTSFPRAADD